MSFDSTVDMSSVHGDTSAGAGQAPLTYLGLAQPCYAALNRHAARPPQGGQRAEVLCQLPELRGVCWGRSARSSRARALLVSFLWPK